jgi:argininosuccinate synthase
MSQHRVRSIQDIGRYLDPLRPVVALFSGGLDSSHLLKLAHDAGIREIIALVVEIGGDVDVDLLSARSGRLGAELMIADARDKFAHEFVVPAIQAQAYYQGNYPVSSSLSRPLIATVAMEVAAERGAQAILHSSHPSQNTLRRLNGSLELLGYPGVFGTPYELTPVPRPAEAAELASAGIGGLAERTISQDSNLWCREFEAGEIEDPEAFVIPEHLYKWTRAGECAARSSVTVRYERGVPVELDGEALGPVALIGELNRLAGRYGLGRYVGLEHLATGHKVLEAREMPGAHVLLAGYAHLLAASVDAETIREKLHLDLLWVREAVEGRWFGRLRAAAQQFITSVSADVNGTVTMAFGPGSMTPVSIRAAAPLYIRDREAWEQGAGRGDRPARPSERSSGMDSSPNGPVLGADEIRAYRRDGYLLLAGFLPPRALAALREAAPRVLAREGPRRIMERDGVTVRSVYGPHQTDPVVAQICQLRELAGTAMDVLGDKVYIHQSKINVKAPFVGDQWEWHQDFIYWLTDDGIAEPSLVNVAVFLDEVTEFNGPLTFVRGSHAHGVLATVDAGGGMPAGYENAPQWVSTLTADEKYRVRPEVIAGLASSGGLASPKGPAGSVLLFHPSILHASSPNISPFGRMTLIVVYNSVSNPPVSTAHPRPEFLAARETAPLTLADLPAAGGGPG